MAFFIGVIMASSYNKLKLKIVERDGFICYYCGCNCRGNYHIDHKIPISRIEYNPFRRKHEPENMVVACIDCNLKKGNSTPEEFIRRIAQELAVTAKICKYLRRILRTCKAKGVEGAE